ncbi:MAG: glycosyltransferase [Lachnospiraceae bacterium]|nr:glycosyltransferase [Lachnospiraceae bacterium]
MNILYLNLYDKFGGAEKICNLLYHQLTQGDVHYRFVLVGNKDSDKNSYSLFSPHVFKEMEEYLIRYDLLKKMVRILVLASIIRIILVKRIDVVHLHNTHDYLISCKGIKLLLKFGPVVWTLHDMWSMTGNCTYSAKCVKWKEGCRKCKNLSAYSALSEDLPERRYLQKKALFQENHLYRVCPSKWLYNMIKESGIGEKNLLWIPNGVDLESFRKIDKKTARKKHHLSENKKYLLFIAASVNNKKKGMTYLLEAVKMLNDMKELEILIIGDIKYKISGNGIPVHCLGYIPDQKVLNEIYAAADLFILPSIEDNFPCTTLEAMASGTPVIAFKVGGIAEQLDDESGFLVEEILSRELAKKIRMALSDQESLSDISEKAHKRCVDLFSADSMNDKYRILYKKALKKYRSSFK